MFLIKWYRYLCGYVYFSISGGFPERFLNLIAQNQISIWDIHRKGEKLYASTLVKDYKKMRPFAKKTKVKLKAEGKKGYKFKANKYKKRRGMFVGFLAMVIVFFVASNLVWTVKVNGNETLESRVILEVLQEEGFKPGCFHKAVNIRDIEQKAMLRLPQLSWLAINVTGGNATVEVKERTVIPDIAQTSDNEVLIASKEGVISRTNIYSGMAAVQKGEVVSKGDVLVHGYYKGNREDSVEIEQDARGEVYAYTTMQKTFYTPKVGMEEVISRTSNNYIYESLGLKIPLIRVKEIPRDSRVTVTSENVKFFGWEMPILKHNQKVEFIDLQEKEYTLEEMKEKLNKQKEEFEGQLPVSTTVVEAEIKEEETEEGLKYIVSYKLEENIAVAP